MKLFVISTTTKTLNFCKRLTSIKYINVKDFQILFKSCTNKKHMPTLFYLIVITVAYFNVRLSV